MCGRSCQRRLGADGHRHRRRRGRAAEAARAAISSPLLEEAIDGATGILLNITGGKELGLFEVNEAAEIIQSAADPNANIIFGAVIDESLGDDVRVTVIGTGFDKRPRRGARPEVRSARSERPDRPDRRPSLGERQKSSPRDRRRRHRHPAVPALAPAFVRRSLC